MKYSRFVLLAIIAIYGFMYLATSIEKKCEDDCQRFSEVQNFFLKDSNHISFLNSCGSINPYDSLCVIIKDSTSCDWNSLADSVCMVATQNGLPKTRVFIINYLGSAPDTLVKKSCP